ncbi:protein SEED AND ROOT HAIR PROTECTIVE PROTEIN [Gossypium raimondii]|nr:protein SEED AND ROOT HAIR PROTECTIVE PROTEIN [Gossypium raimondii]
MGMWITTLWKNHSRSVFAIRWPTFPMLLVVQATKSISISILFFIPSTLLLFSSLVIVAAIDYSQGSESVGKSMPKAKEKPLPIGVEGHILCKSGTSSAVPIQGAVARITCVAVDEFGYETAPFSFSSDATDENGYFFATLTPPEINDKMQLRECKAFLENSPLEACKVPTDVNKGIRGAILNSHRVLDQRKMRLYWVGPFFYT